MTEIRGAKLAPPDVRGITPEKRALGALQRIERKRNIANPPSCMNLPT